MPAVREAAPSPRPHRRRCGAARAGGRLVYAGAGTSGRLAAVDADEVRAHVRPASRDASWHTSPRTRAEEDEELGRAAALAAVNTRPGTRSSSSRRAGATRYALGAARAAADAGALVVAVASVPNPPLARARRPRGRRGHRARGDHRVDADEGGNGPEARAEHDLDGLDDPARPDVREPDGRVVAATPSCGPSAPGRRAGDRVSARRDRGGARRPRAATRRWRSSRCSPAGGRTSRGACSTTRTATYDEPWRMHETRDRSAVVDGVLLRGDVEIVGRAGRGGRLNGGGTAAESAIPGLVDLQVNGFGGVDFAARTTLPTPRRRSAPRVRRHRVPADLDHGARRRSSSPHSPNPA